MRPNLCYYIQVMGPPSPNPPLPPRFNLFLEASGDQVTLRPIPAIGRFPMPDDDSLLWTPIAYITDNYRSFILQNVGSNKIIKTNGQGSPASLIKIEDIQDPSTICWSFVACGGGDFSYLQTPLTGTNGKPLVLNVLNSVYVNPTISVWPIDHQYGTANEIWKFTRQGLLTSESEAIQVETSGFVAES